MRHRVAWLAALCWRLALSAARCAQAAIDPNIAPRAAALEREGERQMAIDLLGHYLATAPDDGRAWFQLGRFYLLDARDWHLRTATGAIPTACSTWISPPRRSTRPIRLSVDSGRGLPRTGRAGARADPARGLRLERRRRHARATDSPPLPAVHPRARRQPAQLLSGGRRAPHRHRPRERSRSGTTAWICALRRLLPIRPDRYATDSRLPPPHGRGDGGRSRRCRCGARWRTSPPRRPLCLTPTADSAAAPALAWMPFRLVRVSRPAAPAPTRSASPSCSRRRAAGRLALGQRCPRRSTTAPPATTPSSAAASSSSSETRPPPPAGP